MTKAADFRHYAEEAVRWADKSTAREKQTMLNLASTWRQAANLSESDVVVKELPQGTRLHKPGAVELVTSMRLTR